MNRLNNDLKCVQTKINFNQDVMDLPKSNQSLFEITPSAPPMFDDSQNKSKIFKITIVI